MKQKLYKAFLKIIYINIFLLFIYLFKLRSANYQTAVGFQGLFWKILAKP